MWLQFAAAVYIYVHIALEKKSGRRWRYWRIFNRIARRSISGGNLLLNDLKRTQDVNGRFQDFLSQSSIEFDFPLHFIGSKIA